MNRACRSAYRALLHCYPTEFRDTYGTEMEETFVDQWRAEARGGLRSLVGLVAVSLADVVLNGLRERFAPQPNGAGMFHLMDVRYAFRLLRRSPAFSLLTVLVLSGGLGLAIFTFSFLYTAMLKPLPISNGDRVVSIVQVSGGGNGPFDAGDIAQMRAGTRTLSEMGVYASQSVVLGDEQHPQVVNATLAEWSVFRFTRTGAMLGRTFAPDDAESGAEPVIVLSHRLWRVAFGADSAVIGRAVPLSGTTTRVIGVMPEGYGFPVASEAWIPINNRAINSPAFGAESYYLFGRVASNVTADDARTELRVLLKRARERDRESANAEQAARLAEESKTIDVAVRTFPMAQIGDEAPMVLAVLNILAGLILLLACINVTNLLLARSNERVRETAVRLALGASRARLVMQSMWETVILCLAGGGVATGIAAWGLEAINGWTRVHLEGNLAFWWVWGLDRSAVIAAGFFVTATIALLGMVVAGRAVSLQFVAVLKDGGGRSGSRREGRVARVLVIAQVCTVTILMFFGVMTGIVAYRVANVEVGYDTRHLLSTTLALDGDKYVTRESRNAMFTESSTALSSATSVMNVLLRADLAGITDPASAIEVRGDVGMLSGTHAYVQALQGDLHTVGLQVRAGRGFDSRDAATGVPVAIISEALATKVFGADSPLGQQLRVSRDGVGEWRTVVGVTSDVLLGPPFSASRSALATYVPLQQTNVSAVQLLFRHRGDAQAAQSALYRTLRTLDATFVPPTVSAYDEILQKSSLIATSTARLFGACFAFALLLAVSGTYGLMARNIGQRTREIGVRRALGAGDGLVIWLLLRQGVRQLGFGVILSLPFVLAVGVGFLRAFPVGVGATVVSAVLVAGSVVLVVLGATYVPTRRAVGTSIRDALWRE